MSKLLGYELHIRMRHEILIMIIRVEIPTNVKIAKSGATVVGSVMTLSALVLYHFVGALDTEYDSAAALINLQLLVAGLRCAFTSDSYAAFTAASVKITLTLDFLLRVSLRTPALGKALSQMDLRNVHFLQKSGVLRSSWMLTGQC